MPAICRIVKGFSDAVQLLQPTRKREEWLMHIVWMLFVGLVIGTLARVVMPDRVGGVIMTIALGLAGSFLAGFFSRALGFYRGLFDVPGVLASVFGAMLIILIFRLIVGPRRRRAVV